MLFWHYSPKHGKTPFQLSKEGKNELRNFFTYNTIGNFNEKQNFISVDEIGYTIYKY